MLLAFLNIIGTLLVLLLFFLATGVLENYRSAKRKDRVFTTAAIKLGIPVAQIDERKNTRQLAQYLANEYDRNKFRNRISDFSQPFFVLYEALTYLIQLGIVASSAWFAFTVDYANAKLAWIAVGLAVLLWLGNLLLGALLQLATGRAPGEAKSARNIAAELSQMDEKTAHYRPAEKQ